MIVGILAADGDSKSIWAGLAEVAAATDSPVVGKATAVELVEVAAATDTLGTGSNVIFATLVDDPASVGDHVDAFLGQIMVEAATAAATVNAGFAYAAAIVEAGTAASTVNASGPITAAIAETAAASSAQDASLISAVMRSAPIAGLSPMQVNSGVPPIKSSRLSSGTALGA